MTELIPPISTDPPLLEAEGLARTFSTPTGPIEALRQAAVSVQAGEMVAVMGPSGSGKSTLLLILGLLLAPSRGSFRMLDQDMLALPQGEQARHRRRNIGFVFQTADMVESCSVFENLEMPLIYAGIRRSERRGRIEAALARIGLAGRIRHPANLLSGGERQRVAVARALVNAPRLILADEPTGQVDRANGRRIVDHLQEYAAQDRAAIVLVTHDPELAERCARIYRIEDGVLYAD